MEKARLGVSTSNTWPRSRRRTRMLSVPSFNCTCAVRSSRLSSVRLVAPPTRIAFDPQAVAGDHRAIHGCAAPVALAAGRKTRSAADVRDSRHAGRWIGTGPPGQDEPQQGEQQESEEFAKRWPAHGVLMKSMCRSGTGTSEAAQHARPRLQSTPRGPGAAQAKAPKYRRRYPTAEQRHPLLGARSR